MTARLTGHIVLEIDGDEQQIESESFVEEHDGLWRYYGDGFILQVTADLEGAVDDEGDYPTHVDEPEIEGTMSVEIIESELAAARADGFEIDEDGEEDDDEDDELDERRWRASPGPARTAARATTCISSPWAILPRCSPGRVLLHCPRCRVACHEQLAISWPLGLLTPGTFLELYRLGKTGSDPRRAVHTVFGPGHDWIATEAADILERKRLDETG